LRAAAIGFLHRVVERRPEASTTRCALQIVNRIDDLQGQPTLMLKRTAAAGLRRLARYCPVVAVTGPRQSGKTTLARGVFDRKQLGAATTRDANFGRKTTSL
jgi:polynucleotide 5'-kinase involved in rRNA processing